MKRIFILITLSVGTAILGGESSPTISGYTIPDEEVRALEEELDQFGLAAWRDATPPDPTGIGFPQTDRPDSGTPGYSPPVPPTPHFD